MLVIPSFLHLDKYRPPLRSYKIPLSIRYTISLPGVGLIVRGYKPLQKSRYVEGIIANTLSRKRTIEKKIFKNLKVFHGIFENPYPS